MSAVRVQISVLGQQRLDRTLAHFAARVQDLRPAWRAILADFLEEQRRRFGERGAGSEPLSSRYAGWKQRKYPGKPPLRRTDRLFQAATGGPGFFQQLSPLSVLFGIEEPRYAIFQQRGTNRMPRRPPIDIKDAQMDRWVRLIARELADDAHRSRAH